MNLSKIKYKYKMTDRPVDRYRKMDKLFCMVMASILKQLFSFIIHVHYTSVTDTFIFCISYHCYRFIVMCQCYYTQINVSV